MKKFFKTTFACVLGTLIAGLILMIIMFVGIIGSVATSLPSAQKNYVVKENTVLKLDLKGVTKDQYEEDVNLDVTSLMNKQDNDVLGLDQFRRALEVAAEDANVKGIYISAEGLSAMPASVDEMRRALVQFKEKSGKWIYAYADSYTQNDYVIASVADKVIINPLGSVNIHGLGGTQIFFPGAFEKFGVEYQIFRVGTYKSAVEPFMVKKMSDANREQTLAYLNTIWDNYTEAVTSSRNITAEMFNAIADSIIALRPTEDMLRLGLVDTMMYRPQVEEWLKAQIGIEDDKEINFASVSELASAPKKEELSENKIALVYAEGEIADGGEGLTSEKFVPLFTKIRKDDNVKAVVLRVNSPGGSAYASEQMWAELEAIQAAGKKVIVSMGEVAASGGYYISCGADYIFAENNTLTGSIGVFGMMPCARKIATETLGLSFDAARTHKHSDFNSGEFLYVGLSPEESAAMQRSVENTYDLFTRRCAEGRNMTQDDIKKIAEGRVWVGKTAQTLGLVDEIGSLEDAIAYAAKVSELEKYEIATYPTTESAFEKIMKKLGQHTQVSLMTWVLGKDAQFLQSLLDAENNALIQARMENVIIR